MEEVTGNSFNE